MGGAGSVFGDDSCLGGVLRFLGISFSSYPFGICSELGCSGDALNHNAHASELRAGSSISFSRDISLMGSGDVGLSNVSSGGSDKKHATETK